MSKFDKQIEQLKDSDSFTDSRPGSSPSLQLDQTPKKSSSVSTPVVSQMVSKPKNLFDLKTVKFQQPEKQKVRVVPYKRTTSTEVVTNQNLIDEIINNHNDD